MADYYHLYGGASKNRMKIIMTDLLHKVENYKNALENTSASKLRHFKIEFASDHEKTWKRENYSTKAYTVHKKPVVQSVKRSK